MVDLDVHIKRLQDKLQLLLKQMGTLQRENAKLIRDLERSIQVTDEKEQALQALKQQVDVLKLGSGGLDLSEKEALGKRIDIYLKEIDKCMALLNT